MSTPSIPEALRPAPAELARLDALFPLREVPVGEDAVVSVRESGNGPALLCLHGIGSGAASWLDVAARLAPQARVIAWDAPGYGHSSGLALPAPKAADYAQRLHALLDTLGVQQCVLVGHSLGALMAAAAAKRDAPGAARFTQLVLISPARGYGAPERVEQSRQVRAERLGTLAQLGVHGMAAHRAGRLLSGGASDASRRWVRWNMAHLREPGYRQAVELLCGDDLLAHLPPAAPVRVLCGEHDSVTLPAACDEVARACDVVLEQIAHAGHACYAEQPGAVAHVLADTLARGAAA